jgi:WD40 repeat protein
MFAFVVSSSLAHADAPFRTFRGHTDAVECVALTPDGQTIVSAGLDSTIRVWWLGGISIVGRKARAEQLSPHDPLLRTLPVPGSGDAGHADRVWCVVVTPDSQHAVSGGGDGTVKAWRLSDGHLLQTLTGHRGAVRSLAITPDGSTILSGSADSTARAWRFSDGALIRVLPAGSYGGHEAVVAALAVSPDGQTIVSGGADGTIKIWQLASGALMRTLTGHAFGWVVSVVVTPDGQNIVSGGSDGTIRIWKLADGELLRILPLSGSGDSGHGAVVNSVTITPDGRKIVSAGWDHTIKVWWLADGVLLRTLAGHTGNVYCVAIGQHGQVIVSGSQDSTIRAWITPPLNTRVPAASVQFNLAQSYPNPFNPATTIRFGLPEAGVVNLTVYDITGRTVRTLKNGYTSGGVLEIVWDGRDANGRIVASGVYVYRLAAKQGVATKRMTLLR